MLIPVPYQTNLSPISIPQTTTMTTPTNINPSQKVNPYTNSITERFDRFYPKINNHPYYYRTDSSYTMGRPLIGIIILASLFLCTLIGALLVILIFCKKKNTVFVLPKQSLSETWRSSIELNSLRSESTHNIGSSMNHLDCNQPSTNTNVPNPNDWYLIKQGRVYPLPSNLSRSAAMDTAILLHLLGYNPQPSNHLPSSVSKASIPRSSSVLPRSTSYQSTVSRLKRAVSKKNIFRMMPTSKTYEKLSETNFNNSPNNTHQMNGDNENFSSVITNLNADISSDTVGCAISKRPWLNKKQEVSNLDFNRCSSVDISHQSNRCLLDNIDDLKVEIDRFDVRRNVFVDRFGNDDNKNTNINNNNNHF